jgi:hypothetical protein
MKIQVSESHWGPRFLLGLDGKMCCLGQAAEQLGIPRETLHGRTMMSPGEMGMGDKMLWNPSPAISSAVAGLGAGNTAGSWQLKNFIGFVNDEYHAEKNPKKREHWKGVLVTAFAEAGYELEFVE